MIGIEIDQRAMRALSRSVPGATVHILDGRLDDLMYSVGFVIWLVDCLSFGMITSQTLGICMVYVWYLNYLNLTIQRCTSMWPRSSDQTFCLWTTRSLQSLEVDRCPLSNAQSCSDSETSNLTAVWQHGTSHGLRVPWEQLMSSWRLVVLRWVTSPST